METPWNPERPREEEKAQAASRILAALKYAANVKVMIAGAQKDSAGVLNQGEHGLVINAFFEQPPTTAAQHNNHGCALALGREWTSALKALKLSEEKAQNEDEKNRADANAAIVRKAKEASE